MPNFFTVSNELIEDDNGNFIPVDPLNADYQDYLAWVAAGNTAGNFTPPSSTNEVEVYGDLRVGESQIFNSPSSNGPTRVLTSTDGVLSEIETDGSGAVVLDEGALLNDTILFDPQIYRGILRGKLFTSYFDPITATFPQFEGNANDVLTSTGTSVEWNGSSGVGDVVRSTNPTVTDLQLSGAIDITGIGAGTSGQLLSSTGTGITWADRSGKNAVINGDFAIDQRVRPGDAITHISTSAFPNNDDAYTLDRWYILSDGNDVVDVTRATDAPTNQLTSIGLDVETVNKKFGIAQIIEQSNCVGLIGENVSLSFKARVSDTTKLDNVKAAIVSWSGTADAVTSDIISAWGAEGTNPTLIANATYENSPANLSVTQSWATYKIENVAIDTASAKNIIVFIWSDVTDTTAGDFLYITDVQLEAGSAATAYERLPIDVQLERCLRYTWGLWQEAANRPFNVGLCTATNKFDTIVSYPVPMRGTPTATYSAGTTFRIFTTTSFAANTIATLAISRFALHMQATRTAADLTSGAAGLFQDANSGSFAYVVVSAEL